MRKRVLLVDDQPKLLRFIEIDLRMRGFEVSSATSGQEALDQVRSAQPDLVLLDMIMPGMDGFQVIRALRAFTNIPIIAFSASPDKFERAMQLGADDFIAKPFLMDELVEKIETLLNHASPVSQ